MWVPAYGKARHMMGTPVARHENGRVHFAFYAGRKVGSDLYVVNAPKLTYNQAVAWIHRRQQNFHIREDSRESFQDKVRRKAIAAQGVEFVKRLKAEARRIPMGEMEWDTMFSSISHTSTLTRKDTLAAQRPTATIRLSPFGDLSAMQGSLPDYVLHNSGSLMRRET